MLSRDDLQDYFERIKPGVLTEHWIPWAGGRSPSNRSRTGRLYARAHGCARRARTDARCYRSARRSRATGTRCRPPRGCVPGMNRQMNPHLPTRGQEEKVDKKVGPIIWTAIQVNGNGLPWSVMLSRKKKDNQEKIPNLIKKNKLQKNQPFW